MKIYVAAAFSRKDDVRRVYQELQVAGHEIALDWTMYEDVRPYAEHAAEASRQTEKAMAGVKDADALLFLADGSAGGRGSFSELGGAIILKIMTGKPDIYVIGDLHESAFFFHPAVERRSTLEEVLRDIG